MDANYAPTDCGYEPGPGFCIQGANQTLRLPLDQSQETRSGPYLKSDSLKDLIEENFLNRHNRIL